MGGHDVLKAAMVERALAPERDRALQRRNQLREAKAATRAAHGDVTWAGGIAATARFLWDAMREAIHSRRMTEAHG